MNLCIVLATRWPVKEFFARYSGQRGRVTRRRTQAIAKRFVFQTNSKKQNKKKNVSIYQLNLYEDLPKIC